MHFILTRKLKFLLQRVTRSPANPFVPSLSFSLQIAGPQLSVHPCKPTTTTGGRGPFYPGGGGARWPPHIYPITHAEALFCGQEQFILTMDVFIMRNFISIILRNFHNYFVDVYFEEKRFSVVWSGFILRRPWNGAATHSPLGTLAATCPSCRQ